MANGLDLKLFFLLLLTLSLPADMIKKQTLACPTKLILQKAVDIDLSDPLKLEMYAVSNECVVLNREDKVQALGYDPRNSQETFQKILYKKTGVELYILRESISVEQGGKKNSYRF